MNKRTFLSLFVLGGLAASSAASAYVLLSPARTWSSTPTYIVDNRGLSSVTDGDGGLSRTVSAIVSSSAWNGAGSGTVINATSGSVSSFTLGDGVPMLNFRDPIVACTGNCLAATFTGYYSGSTITDADIVTNTAHAWASLGEACSNEFYVEGVMVHEIGHALGLGHTTVGGGGGGSDPNSCIDNATCGGQAPGGCWCDSWCSVYGDCCSDGPC